MRICLSTSSKYLSSLFVYYQPSFQPPTRLRSLISSPCLPAYSFEYFGPRFKLESLRSNMDNQNSPAYLENLK